ncbi:UDP-3-O-(3-hydroxymyristoyl)glucosamine N-acyltransferase [Pelagibius litoralis]|uniref:UDP-3-O-acylglucosamine N-acyltransferase n=1 Tax=Pelagibius litoralis TaxID=374515 RepID=A0A967C9Y4_9PROT|nr:UDP-3-O-(3-hydroxymyristoyl)glucosamine N-acyltransferase [Pelagibius litoralis]NIA67303.1 UDP-3-O-(3-hydroxymyristoyl)glucosamine N-acyltransferase [Pelagibius litoralis]
MADSRFFKVAGPFKLVQLADIAEAELQPDADGEAVFSDVAPLDIAGPGQVSFLDNRSYADQFAVSKAGACIVDPEFAERAPPGMSLILTRRPYRGYAKIAQAFYPPTSAVPGVHPSAQIDPSAKVGEGSHLGPGVVVGPAAEIGRGCRIEANVVIGDAVEVGDGTVIGPNASLAFCIVGRACQIHAGARIGTRGFGFSMDPEGFVDVPQLGRVLIEDGVEIGANTTIDRGAGPDTVIGAGAKIDNLVQIGHNVKVGRGCVLVAQSGVAGSTTLEDFVGVAAQAGVSGHLTIGSGARIGAKAGVMRDVPSGMSVLGSPARPVREFFRLCALWERQLKARGGKKG